MGAKSRTVIPRIASELWLLSELPGSIWIYFASISTERWNGAHLVHGCQPSSSASHRHACKKAGSSFSLPVILPRQGVGRCRSEGEAQAARAQATTQSWPCSPQPKCPVFPWGSFGVEGWETGFSGWARCPRGKAGPNNQGCIWSNKYMIKPSYLWKSEELGNILPLSTESLPEQGQR